MTEHLLVVFYIGGALGTVLRQIQAYEVLDPRKRGRWREIGSPLLSISLQTAFWPVFGLLILGRFLSRLWPTR